jgi:hypothetical protein
MTIKREIGENWASRYELYCMCEWAYVEGKIYRIVGYIYQLLNSKI